METKKKNPILLFFAEGGKIVKVMRKTLLWLRPADFGAAVCFIS